MFKLFFLFVLMQGVLLTPLGAAEVGAMTEFNLNSEDRILILAPHPDDEVLGTGGIIQRAQGMKLPLKVAFLTHGDSNEWSFLIYRKHFVFMPGAAKKMGLIRRDEVLAASDILGVEKQNLVFFGYPDFGTLNIWYSHWNDRAPYRSLLTRVTRVPYQGALRPGAFYKGEDILADLRSLLREFKPTKIFVSHPSDTNGDHLAMYLYLRVALWDEHMQDSTEIYPYLMHFSRWPKPYGYYPEQKLSPPDKLLKANVWKEFKLKPEEVKLKKAALEVHKTQILASRKYLLSFIKSNEIFGDFPTVQLHSDQGSAIFQTNHTMPRGIQLPEDLNGLEKNAFIGVEWKYVSWEGDDLIISIELSKPLAKDVEASIYIFGYSQDTPFAKMPKINVKLGMMSYSVYDQNRRLKQSVIKIKRTPNSLTVVVPLKSLGNPDRILTSARTYLGNAPLDSSSWVAAELN